jgi:acyl carrier protein
MQDNTPRLKKTMAAVFGIQPEAIGEHTSIDTVETWDSLRHLNLVLALEEQFQVRIPEEDMVEIMSFAKIRDMLRQQGVSFQHAA